MQIPYVNGARYHRFLPGLISKGVFSIPGDILEIGAFVGVGTNKLAEVAKKYNKRVFVIDVFDPEADRTQSCFGPSMNTLYLRDLGTVDLWTAYNNNTSRFKNRIVTIRGDSKHVLLPVNASFCFAFVDGNHEPSYVRNDFNLAWRHLVHGGVAGFDDYGLDLPGVTATLDKLISEHASEIASSWRRAPRQLFLQRT